MGEQMETVDDTMEVESARDSRPAPGDLQDRVDKAAAVVSIPAIFTATNRLEYSPASTPYDVGKSGNGHARARASLLEDAATPSRGAGMAPYSAASSSAPMASADTTRDISCFRAA